MKCLFLGYDSKETKLVNFLRKKKIKVSVKKNNLKIDDIKKTILLYL